MPGRKMGSSLLLIFLPSSFLTAKKTDPLPYPGALMARPGHPLDNPLWRKGLAGFVRATYCSVIGWSCLNAFLK